MITHFIINWMKKNLFEDKSKIDCVEKQLFRKKIRNKYQVRLFLFKSFKYLLEICMSSCFMGRSHLFIEKCLGFLSILEIYN